MPQCRNITTCSDKTEKLFLSFVSLTFLAFTILWISKSILGIENQFYYYLFGYPYSFIVGLIVAVILRVLYSAKVTPVHEKESSIIRTFRSVTFVIPSFFAMFFVFGVRAYFDYTKGWYSRVIKNILIMIAICAMSTFNIWTSYRYVRYKEVYHVAPSKMKNVLLQIACLYGMFDAISYAIFANDRFENYAHALENYSESFYTVYMVSTVMNGMMWFRYSHEFFGLLNNHSCDLVVRTRDSGVKNLVRQEWAILWGVIITSGFGIGIGKYVIHDYSYIIDILTGILLCMLVIANMTIWYQSHIQEPKAKPHFEHEHWYLTIGFVIAIISIWFNVYDSEELTNKLKIVTIINSINLILQWVMIMASIPIHGVFRIILIVGMSVELMDGMVNEVFHYKHMYHLYEEGKPVSSGTVILTFLSWSIIETYLGIIQIHISHLLSNSPKYKTQEEQIFIRGI
jgi:hypothetical protein